MTFIRIFGQSCKTLQLLFWFPYHPVASWVFYGFLYILSLWKWSLHYCTACVCLPTHVCVFTYHQLESSAQLQPDLWERWTPQSYHIPTSPHQHCFCLVSGCGAGQHTGWDILAQVPYNSLGSSPDPPNYSWIQKANTQSRPSSASDVCHEPEAVKLGSTSGHHFVLYVGRGGKEVSKKSFPNW